VVGSIGEAMNTDKFAGEETGVAAILAVFSAVAGLIIVFAGKPGLGLLFEISAAVLGIIGMVMAVSPRANREVMSIIAIAIAVFGIGVSVLGVIGSTIF
jgi:hypothetical protein